MNFLKTHWRFVSISIGITLMVIFLLLLTYTNLIILKRRANIIFPDDVATSTVGLIFGAGLEDDGSLKPMLKDRVLAGVALYKSGKVSMLMMTGDDGRRYSDEVGAMKNAAMEYGVPENRIVIDPHGYRTYESCYRESKIYGFTEVIAVSQAFHLPRIVYLCENFGIKTSGVSADLHNYGLDSLYMGVREIGARLKAWWQVKITRPLPLVMEK
jgi:vancomycin permeability regulator SanA